MLKEFLQTNVYLPVDKYIRDQSKKPAIRNGSQRGLRMPPVVGLIRCAAATSRPVLSGADFGATLR